MNDALKEEVTHIMSEHRLCVLSTVNAGSKPESAIVGFSYSENLELLVGTSSTTRKFANIQKSPYVAVVIGDAEAEIQYEGVARLLDKSEPQELLKTHFAKVPGSAKYRDDPTQVYLLITPTWLRLTVHEEPNRIEEMSFA